MSARVLENAILIIGTFALWLGGAMRALRHMETHETVAFDISSQTDDASALKALRRYQIKRVALGFFWPIYYLFFARRRLDEAPK